MARVSAIAMFAIATSSALGAARAERAFVPAVSAGLAIGGSTLPDAPMYDSAHYASASLTWTRVDPDVLSFSPEISALGVWHGAATPVGLAGVRIDTPVASSTTLSLSAHVGAAHDVSGLHPAGDATLAIRGGTKLQLGVELAVTGWGATMMMGGDATEAKLVFARLGITLGTAL